MQTNESCHDSNPCQNRSTSPIINQERDFNFSNAVTTTSCSGESALRSPTFKVVPSEIKKKLCSLSAIRPSQFRKKPRLLTDLALKDIADHFASSHKKSGLTESEVVCQMNAEIPSNSADLQSKMMGTSKEPIKLYASSCQRPCVEKQTIKNDPFYCGTNCLEDLQQDSDQTFVTTISHSKSSKNKKDTLITYQSELGMDSDSKNKLMVNLISLKIRHKFYSTISLQVRF
jgi:hypothetical protein